MDLNQKSNLVLRLASTFGCDLDWQVKACQALDSASPTLLYLIARSAPAEQRALLEKLIADNKRIGAGTAHTFEKQSDETSVSISEVNTTILQQLTAGAGFNGSVVSAKGAPLRAKPTQGTKPFNWKLHRASKANTSYMVDYFNSIVPPPEDDEWIDCSKFKGFLDCKVPGTNVVLKGTANVALCTSGAIRNAYEKSGIRIVVEVEEPGDTTGNLPRLAAELLGANYYSAHLKPIGVLTDVVNSWRLMWYADGAFVAYTCDNRAEAIGILRAFLQQERLTPDGTAIAREKRQAGPATSEEEVDVLFKRQKLPDELGPSDVANLGDLQDFADDLGEDDVFQLTHAPLMRRLLEQASFVPTSADGAMPLPRRR